MQCTISFTSQVTTKIFQLVEDTNLCKTGEHRRATDNKSHHLALITNSCISYAAHVWVATVPHKLKPPRVDQEPNVQKKYTCTFHQ